MGAGTVGGVVARWVQALRERLTEWWRAPGSQSVPAAPPPGSGPPAVVASTSAAGGGAAVPTALPVTEPGVWWRLSRIVTRRELNCVVALTELGEDVVPMRAAVSAQRVAVARGAMVASGELLVEARAHAAGEYHQVVVGWEHHEDVGPAPAGQWRWSPATVELQQQEGGTWEARLLIEGYLLSPELFCLPAAGHGLPVRGECLVGHEPVRVVLHDVLVGPVDRVVRADANVSQLKVDAANGQVIISGTVTKTTHYAVDNVVREATSDLPFTEIWPAPGRVRAGDDIECRGRQCTVTSTAERRSVRQEVELRLELAVFRPQFGSLAADRRPRAGYVAVLAEVQVGDGIPGSHALAEGTDAQGQIIDFEVEVRSVETVVAPGHVTVEGSVYQNVLYSGADGLVRMLDRRTRFCAELPVERARAGMRAYVEEPRATAARLTGGRGLRWQVVVEFGVRLTEASILYVPA